MPFAKTALFDAHGAGLSEGSSGENLTHFNMVRMRVTGTGNLRMVIHSQDEIVSKDIVPPIDMSLTTNIQPTRLTNFIQQRAQLEIYTDDKNEIFRINRIIVFTKEVYSSYPG